MSMTPERKTALVAFLLLAMIGAALYATGAFQAAKDGQYCFYDPSTPHADGRLCAPSPSLQ
jgi:hypothetical protein